MPKNVLLAKTAEVYMADGILIMFKQSISLNVSKSLRPLKCHTVTNVCTFLFLTLKEKSQRLVIFETFDQSDEKTRPDSKKPTHLHTYPPTYLPTYLWPWPWPCNSVTWTVCVTVWHGLGNLVQTLSDIMIVKNIFIYTILFTFCVFFSAPQWIFKIPPQNCNSVTSKIL